MTRSLTKRSSSVMTTMSDADREIMEAMTDEQRENYVGMDDDARKAYRAASQIHHEIHKRSSWMPTLHDLSDTLSAPYRKFRIKRNDRKARKARRKAKESKSPVGERTSRRLRWSLRCGYGLGGKYRSHGRHLRR